MLLDELLRDWEKGRFLPAYYFSGDHSLIREALTGLKKALKIDAADFSRFGSGAESRDIMAELLTPSFLAPRRLVAVESGGLSAAGRVELAGYLEKPVETSILVLISDGKKSIAQEPLSRAVSAVGRVCHFFPLSENEAQSRLQAHARFAGKALGPGVAETLIGEVGSDWTLLRSELDKILTFIGESRRVEKADVQECLGYSRALDPFALARLIQKRANPAVHEEVLADLSLRFAQGRKEDQVFGSLYQIMAAVNKQFKAVCLAKAGRPAPDIFKALRLHPSYDRDFLAVAQALGAKRLKIDLRECLETETRLKSQAWLDPAIELQVLVSRLCAHDVQHIS